MPTTKVAPNPRLPRTPLRAPLSRKPLGQVPKTEQGTGRVAGIVVFAFLIAASARADAGIPMLAVAWPALWLLLVPVIVFEALFAHRILSLSWGKSFGLSTVANLWSTFAGVPVTWVVLLVIEFLFGGLLYASGGTGSFWGVLFFPFMVAWIGPSEKAWPIYAAGAVLCIPFGLVSIWIEAKVGVRRLGPEVRDRVRLWSRVANGSTYGVCLLVLAGMAFTDWVKHK